MNKQLLKLIPVGLLATALLALVFVDIGRSQSGVNRVSTMTGHESFGDAANPTGSVVPVLVLTTQALAASAKTLVGSLPTCNSARKGYFYEVTDANGPTYGATLTGGSTSFALALCDGTNWTAH